MTQNVIFFDTEFTSWEGAQASNWGEDWQYRELVQIGAIRFDIVNMVEIDSFDILIQPVKNPVLSDYFIDLTHITNEELKQSAMPFKQAYDQFIDYIKDGDIYSYGGDDSIINENRALYELEDQIPLIKGNDISPWFKEQGIDTSKINSGALATHLGVDVVIKEHNATEDARSIALAFKELMKRGHKSPFLK